ncbi:MAG: hypothetical protein M3Q05_06665 [Bacteroidota bacterium]|nr:hypothetical protein [Bacteroidota bacterium]
MNLPLIKSNPTLPLRKLCFRRPVLQRFSPKPNFWQLSFLLLFSAFISVSSAVYAQENLVGLTSNGGPEGKGTLFSVKTNGTGYSVLKGFVDWGKAPYGHLEKATMEIFMVLLLAEVPITILVLYSG